MDAGESTAGAKAEEIGETVLNLGPREPSDHAVVHDEEPLLRIVEQSGRGEIHVRGSVDKDV